MKNEESENSMNQNKESRLPREQPNFTGLPYRLMTPGPVPVHPEVLKSLSEQPIHHRTPAFKEILQRSLKNLKKVFLTEQPVMILNATGSGAMEAAISNTLNIGDKVLSIEAGKFGQRWTKIAENFGCSVDAIAVPWGMAVESERIRKELQLTDFRAVLIQACETSTGAYQPIEEIARVVREFPNTLLIVDGITAVGAMPIAMDRWGIDVLIAGSQKAFMLPTGMSFIALSEKAWATSAQNQQRKFYFDLAKEKKANEDGQTHFSSSVTLIRALDVALDVMLKDGLSQHLKRLELLARATRAGADVLGLSNFSTPPCPSLSVFLMPDGVNSQKVRKHLEEKYNITIMGGQDHLKEKILRIGHMGYISDEDAVQTLLYLGKSLHDLHPAIFGNSLAEQAAGATYALLEEKS